MTREEVVALLEKIERSISAKMGNTGYIGGYNTPDYADGYFNALDTARELVYDVINEVKENM